MSWILIAFLAPALYSIVNFVDKYIVEKVVSDYQGMPIFGAIAGIVFGFIFWVATGFPVLSPLDTLIIVATGILTIWAALFYFKALTKEETSLVIILFQLVPIMVLVMSFIFLKESITSKQLIGFILILASAVGISLKKEKNLLHMSPALTYVLIADFLWAISYVLFAFLTTKNSFSELISYESWGIGIGGLIMYTALPSVRKAFLKTFKKAGKKALSYIFLNEAIFVLGKFTFFLAISLGPVTMVSVIASTQTFFGILYGMVAASILPKVFKEEISKDAIFKKMGFAALALFGVWLIT